MTATVQLALGGQRGEGKAIGESKAQLIHCPSDVAGGEAETSDTCGELL